MCSTMSRLAIGNNFVRVKNETDPERVLPRGEENFYSDPFFSLDKHPEQNLSDVKQKYIQIMAAPRLSGAMRHEFGDLKHQYSMKMTSQPNFYIQ